MKRIMVVGCCGAGKSTFARKLHESTLLPLKPLDRFFWKPGWVETPKGEWAEIVTGLAAEDKWIIDGNYGGTMEIRMARADTVIWLDMPRYLCTFRVLKRLFVPTGETRSDMAIGCEERFDLDFLKYVWNFKRDKNPNIEKRFAAVTDDTRMIRLTRDIDADEFLSAVSTGMPYKRIQYAR